MVGAMPVLTKKSWLSCKRDLTMSVHFSVFLKLWGQKPSPFKRPRGGYGLKCNIEVVFLKLIFPILSSKSGIIASAFMIILY